MAKTRSKKKSKNNVEKIENLDWAAAIDDSARLIIETRRDFEELGGTAINRWVNKHIPLVLNVIKGLRKDDKIEAVMAAIAAHNDAVNSFRENMNENKDDSDDEEVDDEEDDDDDESGNNNSNDDDKVDDEEEEEDDDMDLGNSGPRTRSARARARAARSAGGTKGKGSSNSDSGSGKKKKEKKGKEEIGKDYSPSLDPFDFDDVDDFDDESDNDKGNKNKSKGKGKGKDKNKGNKKNKNGKKNKGRGGNKIGGAKKARHPGNNGAPSNNKRKSKSGVNGSNDRMDNGFVYDEEVDEKLNGNRPRGRGSRRKGEGDDIFIDRDKVRNFKEGINDLKGNYKGKRKEVMFCVNCITSVHFLA